MRWLAFVDLDKKEVPSFLGTSCRFLLLPTEPVLADSEGRTKGAVALFNPDVRPEADLSRHLSQLALVHRSRVVGHFRNLDSRSLLLDCLLPSTLSCRLCSLESGLLSLEDGVHLLRDVVPHQSLSRAILSNLLGPPRTNASRQLASLVAGNLVAWERAVLVEVGHVVLNLLLSGLGSSVEEGDRVLFCFLHLGYMFDCLEWTGNSNDGLVLDSVFCVSGIDAIGVALSVHSIEGHLVLFGDYKMTSQDVNTYPALTSNDLFDDHFCTSSRQHDFRFSGLSDQFCFHDVDSRRIEWTGQLLILLIFVECHLVDVEV